MDAVRTSKTFGDAQVHQRSVLRTFSPAAPRAWRAARVLKNAFFLREERRFTSGRRRALACAFAHVTCGGETGENRAPNSAFCCASYPA